MEGQDSSSSCRQLHAAEVAIAGLSRQMVEWYIARILYWEWDESSEQWPIYTITDSQGDVRRLAMQKKNQPQDMFVVLGSVQQCLLASCCSIERSPHPSLPRTEGRRSHHNHSIDAVLHERPGCRHAGPARPTRPGTSITAAYATPKARELTIPWHAFSMRRTWC